MNTSQPLPAVYAELVAEEQSLAALVESINQRSDYRALAVAEIELAMLRRVMATFADDEKVARPPEDFRARRRDAERGRLEEMLRTLPAELEAAEAKMEKAHAEFSRPASPSLSPSAAAEHVGVARGRFFEAQKCVAELRARLAGIPAHIAQLDEEAVPGYEARQRRARLAADVAALQSEIGREEGVLAGFVAQLADGVTPPPECVNPLMIDRWRANLRDQRDRWVGDIARLRAHLAAAEDALRRAEAGVDTASEVTD
jgi:hypothetical protein